MPEFRFRRKKHRHTLHDATEAAAQIKAAREKVEADAKTNGDVKRANGAVSDTHSTNTLTREREKFIELLKSKYPEHVAADLELFTNNRDPVSPPPSISPPMTNGRHSFSPQEDGAIRCHSDDDVIKTTSTSELPAVTASLARRISSRFNECIFLRYGSDLRHCPMPSPITLSTIRNLFVNMFDLSPSLLGESECQLFIKDKETERWRVMENTSMITNRCTVLLVDPAQGHTHPDSLVDIPPNAKAEMEEEGEVMSGGEQEQTERRKRNGLWRAGHQFDDLTTLSDTMPIHSPPEATAVTSPLSINSSTSGVGSDVGLQPHQRQRLALLARQAEGLRQNAHRLREELNSFRHHHAATADDFSQALLATKESITAAVSAFRKIAGLKAVGTEDFRRERLELYAEEEAYDSHSERTLHSVNVLECAVEGVRRDVVERRCKVDDREVEGLNASVRSVTRALQEVKERYTPLEKKMKRVMQQELQIIVKEEGRYIADENAKLQEAWEKCTKLTEVLETLKQFSTVQDHRTPHVPVMATSSDPDRHALMENIEAITPNHLHRMECLQLAEQVQKRRKEFTSPKQHIRKFENQLQVQHDLLRHTRNTMDLEKRREMKLKAYYLSEKFEREKQLAQELEVQKKMAEQKRESERRAVQERLLRDQQNRMQDKRAKEQDKRSREQDRRLREQDRRSREIKSHEVALLGTAPEKATAPNPAFAQNGVHPSHKSKPTRIGNGLPHTGRASLAPHANLKNLPPKDRKSIGYAGEYDTLEPAHSLSQPEMPVSGDGMAWNYPSRHTAGHRAQGLLKYGAPGVSAYHHRLSITSSSTSSNSQGSQPQFQPPQALRDGGWGVAAPVEDGQLPVRLRKPARNDAGAGRVITKKRSTVHEAMFDQKFYVDDFMTASLSQPELEMRHPLVSAETQKPGHKLGFTQRKPQRAASDDSIYNLDETPGTERKASNPAPQPSQARSHIPIRQNPHGRANARNRYSYHPTTGDFMMQTAVRQPPTGAATTTAPESTQRVAANTASSSKARNKQSGGTEKLAESPPPASPSPSHTVIHHSYTKFAPNPKPHPKSPTSKNPQLAMTKASASMRGGKAKKGSKQQTSEPPQDLKHQTGQSDPRPLHQADQSNPRNLGGNVDRAPTNNEGVHWSHGDKPTVASATGINSRLHHPPPSLVSHPHKSHPPHHHHTQSHPPQAHSRQPHAYYGIDEPLTSYPRFHGNAGAPHGQSKKASRLSGNPGRGPAPARLPVATKTGYPSSTKQREPMGSLV